MKIATLTIDEYNNHGNILQRYALVKVLNEYTDEVDSLWFDNNSLIEMNWKKSGMWLNKDYKQIIKFLINRKNFRTNIIFGNNHKIIYRDSLIKSFCDRYIPMRYDVNFKNIDNEYDYFIVGSDQVWNPCQGLDFSKLMLGFASPRKRVSYAASISVPEIPIDKREEFIEGIIGMNCISVREIEGSNLIKKMTGKDATVVIDPTLMISTNHWRTIARKPSWLNDNENYLLTYFLGPYSRNIIDKIASKRKLKVINMFGLKNFDASVVAPEEWLYLIDHASLFYTDSFHGTVFSILFNTPFVVMDRQGECKMSSRIDTLLDMFHLGERRGNNTNEFLLNASLECDFRYVDEVIKEKKQIAHNYLSQILI